MPAVRPGCSEARRDRKSPAVITCSVPRIAVPRTSCLSRNSLLRPSRVMPATRVHSPMYGGFASCACSPTRRSTAAIGVSFARSSSS